MNPAATPFLRNLWYYVCPATELRRGRMMHKQLVGEPILLGRDSQDHPFALRDICPHRAIPLSAGHFDGHEVECAYHGWRFDTEGRCTAIPSLVEGQVFDINKIGVLRYPLREQQGSIWIYIGDPAESLPAPPRVPDMGEAAPRSVTTVTFTSELDQAVIGLIDPAHGPYVHRSWFWRTKRSQHEKSKAYVPSHLGFTMARHRASKNSFAYKILGGIPEIEISFQLPGIRIEHIRTGRHTMVGLTCVTPIDSERTELTQSFYWTMPWMTLLKPVLQRFFHLFLNQDRRVLTAQHEGLKFNPNMMLINDADTLAKWYLRLKKEYAAATLEGREFVNPIEPRTLRWRT